MVARSERFELPTLGFEVRCSIQLSYERVRPFRWVSRTPNFLGIVRGRPPKSISTPDYQSWPERATGWGKPDNMRIGIPQRPAGVNCVMLFRIAR